MNAEEFVTALHTDILVDHLGMYERRVREAKESAAEDAILNSFLDEPLEPMFVATLSPDQAAGYLDHVQGILQETVSSVLGMLDGSVPLGDAPTTFQLIPAGGADIAGDLNSLFVGKVLAAAGFVSPLAGLDIDPDVDGQDEAETEGAPMTTEEFVDRVREVLFDDLVPGHAELADQIAAHADDPTADGYGTAQFRFLASLSDEQRAAYLSLRSDAVQDTAVAILGILDGVTATRGDDLRFEVIPPDGSDIAGDLQEFFLIAQEDGPFGGRTV